VGFDSRLLSGIGVLAAVVEAGSFVRAAESLGLTQSGVSRAVARLERRVGVRLFIARRAPSRSPRKGEAFINRSSRISPASRTLPSRRRAPPWPCAAGCGSMSNPFSPASFSPRALANSWQPIRSCRWILGRDRIGDLVADGFDAALRFGEPEPSSLVARRLLETRVLTCAAPAYLAKHGRPTHPRELGDARHECIHFVDPVIGRPYSWEFHRRRQKIQVAVSGRLTVNNAGTLLGACAAGHGIAQVLALGTEDLRNNGTLVELFPDWPDERFPLYVLHLSRHVPPAKLRAFLDFVVRSVADA